MSGLQIGSLIFAGAMLLFLFPRAKQMLENSPKGSNDDWKAFIIPVAAVAGFVFLLVYMARN